MFTFAPALTSYYHRHSFLRMYSFLLPFFMYFKICTYDLPGVKIIPGCCSQSLQCSPSRMLWWLAIGDMLHIPWAQDLLLVIFVRNSSFYLSPLLDEICQTRVKTHWKLVWSCKWRISQHHPASLLYCHSFFFHLRIILLSIDYLTYVSASSIQACLCVEAVKMSLGLWNSCSWKRVKLHGTIPFNMTYTTHYHNGSSISVTTVP